MPINANNKSFTYSGGAKTANSPVLATNVTPSETPVVFDITTAVNTSTAVDLVTWDGTTEFNKTLNGGSAIGADDLFQESVNVNDALEYNVQYRQDVSLDLLTIDERALEDEN